MSAHSDSRNRDRDRERVMIALQTKRFLAGGGKIQQVPIGASGAPKTMDHRAQNEAAWRAANAG